MEFAWFTFSCHAVKKDERYTQTAEPLKALWGGSWHGAELIVTVSRRLPVSCEPNNSVQKIHSWNSWTHRVCFFAGTYFAFAGCVCVYVDILVGGLQHFLIFPYIGNNHPNWLVFICIYQRGWNHQPVYHSYIIVKSTIFNHYNIS